MTADAAGQVNFQRDAAARRALPAACGALAADLADAAPARQLALLQDTRPLHRALFAPLLPPARRGFAGQYRGTPGTPVERSARAVFVARRAPGLKPRDLCTPAAEVAAAMAALAQRIEALWRAAEPAPPSPDAAFAQLAEVSHGFLAVHPYVDGNGHVFRLTLPVFAARLGLAARPDWTAHPRPYDHVLSLCLQWYPHHPLLLACYLRRWFDPAATRDNASRLTRP